MKGRGKYEHDHSVGVTIGGFWEWVFRGIYCYKDGWRMVMTLERTYIEVKLQQLNMNSLRNSFLS
jgi:hypothetical protein